MTENVEALKTRISQLTEQLHLAEKKIALIAVKCSRQPKIPGLSSCHASAYAARRLEELLKRAVDIDCGKGI